MKFEKTKIYGVTGVGKSATLTRTDDAKNFNPGWSYNMDGQTIKSDFDNCFPWSDMQEVEQDGSTFIKIPKFYAKVTTDTDGSYKYQISGCRYEGFSTLFIDGKGNEIDYVLVGKYEASITLGSANNTAMSKTSSNIMSDTIDNMRSYCTRIGAGYQQYDFLIDGIIKLLFTVEFATTDAQSVMIGCVGYSVGSGGHSYVSGETDLLAYPSGAAGKSPNASGFSSKYRGIENIYGGRDIWCDGIYLDGYNIYLCTDPTEYGYVYRAEDDTNIVAPYFYVGDRSGGGATYYTRTIHPFAKIPLLSFVTSIATEPTVESAVFGNDIFNVPTGSTRISCGGNDTNNNYAGLWHFKGDTAQSTAACRLCYKPI